MEFEFPDTGEGVTEGKFLEWKVDEGDEIEEDQVVGEAETDKAVVEIPAPDDGKVKNLEAAPGDTVHVGDVIMELETGEVSEEASEDETDTEGENKTDAEKDESSESEAKEPETEEGSGNPVVEDVPVSDSSEGQETGSDSGSETPETYSASGDVLALPKVRKLAEEKGVDLASIKTGERITEQEVREAAEAGTASEGSENKSSSSTSSSEDVKATPAVRKLAREKGLDITQIEGSGRGGKVTRQDVLDYAESGGEDDETSKKSEHERKAEEHPVHSDREVEREELSGIRQKIADRMEKSRFTAPHVTHADKADLTKLKEMREEEKDEVEPHL
ncbi:MAG: E3 binding domain-containing protein, partial [Candidatus Nanosalina sp.]